MTLETLKPETHHPLRPHFVSHFVENCVAISSTQLVPILSPIENQNLSKIENNETFSSLFGLNKQPVQVPITRTEPTTPLTITPDYSRSTSANS